MQNKLEKNPQKSVQIKNWPEKIRIFSGAQLKYLAFISMLIDHVNKALIYPNLDGSAGLQIISDLFENRGVFNCNITSDLCVFPRRRIGSNRNNRINNRMINMIRFIFSYASAHLYTIRNVHLNTSQCFIRDA